jgi:hypothetical protein
MKDLFEKIGIYGGIGSGLRIANKNLELGRARGSGPG